MSIGSTIKKLRQQHDMTQEQLAELLNLTSAAVSGWECGRTSPDISQVPLLAHIFDVSADVLLGIDLSAREAKIENIIIEAEKHSGKEAVELYRLGLAEFPASYELMLRLANALNYRGEPETYHSRQKEQIALYQRIREGTKDAYTKNCAEGWLCRIYLSQGKRDEAMKIAEDFPNYMFYYNDFERMLAQGKDKVYQLHHSIQGGFATLCDDICFLAMQEADGKPFFTHQQAISILEKIPKLYEAFYENKDYLDDGTTLALAYTRMAEHYADLKDETNTLRCIVSALENAGTVDTYYEGLQNGPYGISDAWDYPQMPKEKRHTSILADPNYDYPTTTVWINTDSETLVQHHLKIFSGARFDFIRDEVEKIIHS